MRTALYKQGARGFTLLELMLALLISSALVAALAPVFTSTLDLRTRTEEKLQQSAVLDGVASALRRDLMAVPVPNGLFAGPWLGTHQTVAGERSSDSLELYTASGITSDAEPWGDLQKVSYHLGPSAENSETKTFTLFRSASRNLLAPTEAAPEEVPLLDEVVSLSFSYLSEDLWQESWDSTQQQDAAPEAVRVRIERSPNARSENQPVQVLELVVELSVEAATDEAAD